jgi:hypothetical protein
LDHKPKEETIGELKQLQEKVKQIVDQTIETIRSSDKPHVNQFDMACELMWKIFECEKETVATDQSLSKLIIEMIRKHPQQLPILSSDSSATIDDKAFNWMVTASERLWSDNELRQVLQSVSDDKTQATNLLKKIHKMQHKLTAELKLQTIPDEVGCYYDFEQFVWKYLEAHNYTDQQNLTLKVSADGANITKKGLKLFSVNFDVLLPGIDIQKAMSPYNSNTVLLFEFTAKIEERYDNLRRVLEPFLKSFNKVLSSKQVSSEGKLFTFKDVTAVFDLEAAIAFAGVYQVYTSDARYPCLFCKVQSL